MKNSVNICSHFVPFLSSNFSSSSALVSSVCYYVWSVWLLGVFPCSLFPMFKPADLGLMCWLCGLVVQVTPGETSSESGSSRIWTFAIPWFFAALAYLRCLAASSSALCSSRPLPCFQNWFPLLRSLPISNTTSYGSWDAAAALVAWVLPRLFFSTAWPGFVWMCTTIRGLSSP